MTHKELIASLKMLGWINVFGQLEMLSPNRKIVFKITPNEMQTKVRIKSDDSQYIQMLCSTTTYKDALDYITKLDENDLPPGSIPWEFDTGLY